MTALYSKPVAFPLLAPSFEKRSPRLIQRLCADAYPRIRYTDLDLRRFSLDRHRDDLAGLTALMALHSRLNN